MKLWNGYRWSEYSGDPVEGPVLATSTVDAVQSLDPALKVVTDDVASVEAAHARYRTEHDDTGERPAINFDTSDEETDR